MSGACQQALGAVAPVGERAPPRTVATLPPRNEPGHLDGDSGRFWVEREEKRDHHAV
jgi:hypothetical protein